MPPSNAETVCIPVLGGPDIMRPPLRFYLASRYTRREELCEYKADLIQRGHTVPARWLLGEHQVHGVEAARAVENPDGFGNRIAAEAATLFATDDVDDLLASDVVVNFTETPRSGNSRGGRHVEFGIALGQRLAGEIRHLFIVGPMENVFHALPEIDGYFDTWPEFLAHLDDQPEIHGWDRSGNSRCHQHPWHKTNGWHRSAWPHNDSRVAVASSRQSGSEENGR